MTKFVIWFLFATVFSTITAVAQGKTENLFLITIDGLRWNEVFTGAERKLLNKDRGGVDDTIGVQEKFWRDSASARRKALMPFFWTTLIKEGVVYGNRNLGSEAIVTNEIRISYPGYAEILTGSVQPEITTNEKKQIQEVTILEFLKSELQLSDVKVAAFTSWDLYPYAVSRKPGAVYCNAGYTPVNDGRLTQRQSFLNVIQDEIPKQWSNVRYDALTFHHGMEFIKKNKPRVFYFAFGETDDWAHDKRYDHVLEAAHRVDNYLKVLWQFVSSDPQYAGKTSFIITADHGRGSSDTENWTNHGREIPGSEYIWVAVFGPDSQKKGELSQTPTVHAKDIAATMAKLLGLDFRTVAPGCGQTIPLATH